MLNKFLEFNYYVFYRMEQYYGTKYEAYIGFNAIYCFLFYAILIFINSIFGYNLIEVLFNFSKQDIIISRFIITPIIISPIFLFTFIHYKTNKEKIENYLKSFAKESKEDRKRKGRYVMTYILFIVMLLFMSFL